MKQLFRWMIFVLLFLFSGCSQWNDFPGEHEKASDKTNKHIITHHEKKENETPKKPDDSKDREAIDPDLLLEPE